MQFKENFFFDLNLDVNQINVKTVVYVTEEDVRVDVGDDAEAVAAVS